MKSTKEIQAEFDHVALDIAKYPQRSEKIKAKIDFLDQHIPAKCETALDIGCGTGDVVRYLAQRSDHVLGIDLSPEMIRISSERSANMPNAEFQIADMMIYDLPKDHFDFVVSFMTMHHMPLEIILEKIKSSIKPGGTLVIQDEYNQEGLVNKILSTYYDALKFVKISRRKMRGTYREHAKFEEHDPNEIKPLIKDIKRACSTILPGSQIREYPGKARYSLVWKKNI